MIELLLPFEAVPLERPRTGQGKRPHDTQRNRAVKEHVARLYRLAHPREPVIPAGVPVMIVLDFHYARPPSHYRGRRVGADLREDAPRWHAQRPDTDNLVKLVKDALNGVAWHDDAQVSVVRASKRWTTGDGHTRLTITRL